MKTKLAAISILLGALLMPVAGYTADNDAGGDSSAKTYVKDSVITAKVKAAFAKDKAVSAMHIKVDTDNKGVVTLGGTARSQAEADRAVELAHTVEGVTSVQNTITVNPDR